MGERKKIVYLIGSMRRGGAEGQVAALLRHFNNDAFESSLYLLNEVGDHLGEVREMGVQVRGFGFERRHSLLDPRTALQVSRTIGSIAGALAEDRPDVLHCFLYWADIFGARAGARARTPCVVTSRRSMGNYKNGRPWMQWIENRANRGVDAVTVNSEAVRADVLKREKIDPKKIHLLYNGVEIAARPTESDRAALRSELGIDPEQMLIVYVANLIHYKGHLTLIDAMEAVVRSRPWTRLVLAGRDGGMEATIRERISAGGLGANVSLLGLRSSTRDLYAAADLVVHPSDEEGFSNVILEAMASGRAIVASAVGGIPEAVTDGVEGRLVAPCDPPALARAIVDLLGDDARRAKMGEAARARAERDFSLPAMFAKYETFYRDLLK